MPRKPEPGIRALLNYQPVRYFPFPVEPGQAMVLTVDPWSYLAGWLAHRVPNAHAKRRRNLENALYYSHLAEQFYRAADYTDLPAKGALAYYSMLNLAKVLLCLRGVDLGGIKEHHGLTLPPGAEATVEVHSPAKEGINIFHELAGVLGTPTDKKRVLTLAEIVSHIPELHEIAFTSGALPAGKRRFLPIEILFLVNRSKDRLFTEVRYEKQQETRVTANNFLQGARKAYFLPPREENGWLAFRSKTRKPLTKANWPTLYRYIREDYEQFQITTILTRSGYRYYCDLGDPVYHHLCYSYMLLYYVGSTARYRPAEVEANMRSAHQAFITEAVTLCPRQLLYHLVSHATYGACVVPYASL